MHRDQLQAQRSVTSMESLYLFRGMKYCDQHVCLLVSLFVCLTACVSQKKTRPHFTKFLYVLPVVVVQSSSEDNVIHYVFPVSG